MELVIKETLEKLFEILGVNFTDIKVFQDEKGAYLIDVQTPESSLLIGRHGDTISALQHILRSLLWQQGISSDEQVILDIDGYKKRQEENVIRMAERKAEYAISSRRSVYLPPMNPYLRRKVHLHLAKKYESDITTNSVGMGSRRQIKIFPQK